MQPERQQRLADHIGAVDLLGAEELDGLKRLAVQLHPERLLPVLGAGASVDCGMRVAREIARELYSVYRSNYSNLDEAVTESDLAGIAEAIFVQTKDQKRVVADLGLPDPKLWRPAHDMGDHFCCYCVLARMVAEKLLKEAFSFNYDCGAEAGFATEGFASGEIASGQHWPDRARVLADAASHASTSKDQSSFTLYKANGCAARYRKMAETDADIAAREIVVRDAQINSWGTSAWSRSTFESRVENHVVVLIGFSGQDPKVSRELRDVLDRVYRDRPSAGTPRVVAIDKATNPTAIEALIDAGLGGQELAEGAVKRIRTGESTATAALLVLLVELLKIELFDHLSDAGVELPAELGAQIATLAISAPTMRRWAYLVGEPEAGDLIQRANLLSEAGYVPLTHRGDLTARLIGARASMRARLGRHEEETAAEALDDHGFLLDPSGGLAYMPVGIEHERLIATCRPGPELEKVKTALMGRYPSHLDCVFVSGDGNALRGVSLATGREVDIV